MAITTDSGTNKEGEGQGCSLPFLLDELNGYSKVYPNATPIQLSKANSFIIEAGAAMDEFRKVCAKYNFPDIKKIFVFTVTDNQYNMLIDYEALLFSSK